MFKCDCCIYQSINKSNYFQHLKGKKHIKLLNKNNEDVIYNCKNCNKPYLSYVGLCNHNKKCLNKNTTSLQREPTIEIINEIMKGFFINKNTKKIDILIHKEKTKILNKKINSIYLELESLLQNPK